MMMHKVSVLKESSMYYLNGIKEKKPKEGFLMTLTTITIIPLLLLTFTTTNLLSNPFIYESFAQSTTTTTTTTSNKVPETFKVIVGVTNNADDDKVGSIYLMVDGTSIVKNLNGVLFPAKQSMTFPIEFDITEVTAGNGYTVEVVYGDDLSKRLHDSISSSSSSQQSNSPEVINIAIP